MYTIPVSTVYLLSALVMALVENSKVNFRKKYEITEKAIIKGGGEQIQENLDNYRYICDTVSLFRSFYQ